MFRKLMLATFAALGFLFLSRSCAVTRANGAIVLMHGRIVLATGFDQTTEFVAIAGGKIASVSFFSESAAPTSGARAIDVTGLYVAAATFDRSAPAYIDGIRHVWVGQLKAGDPGDVVIMRTNPARVRAGFIPDNSDIAGAVIDGVYCTPRDLARGHSGS